MSSHKGKLYIVATPIGNLGDFSYRGVDVLQQVDLIAAEDTRHVRPLLQHYGINNKVVALHQHNEYKLSPEILEKVSQGQNIALVSDAGTPLLSDPGLPIVTLAHEMGIDVVPIPGPCALITALSVAGLPMSEFTFSGFLPRTSKARKALFAQRLPCPETWVFYESSHRILDAISDLAQVFPTEREMTIARELTKLYETIVTTSIAQALISLQKDENMRRGEFVVIVSGAEPIPEDRGQLSSEQQRVLGILLQQCSIKTAVAMAVEITGARKKVLYKTALEMFEKSPNKQT